MDDSDADNLLYRRAYGLACRLIDARRTSFADGSREVRFKSAPIPEEVLRQIGETDNPETVRDGVEDAMAGKRPRW